MHIVPAMGRHNMKSREQAKTRDRWVYEAVIVGTLVATIAIRMWTCARYLIYIYSDLLSDV